MRILIINEVCGHTSTGKICAGIAEKYEAGGHTVRIAFGRSAYVPQQYRKYAVRIGNDWDVRFHALLTRLTDRHGLGSKKATETFLRWAEGYNPDRVWLHNLHGYYIHVELLFRWIKTHPQMEVWWTLHDCWPFTGHCVHFTMAKCEKWRTGCHDCPQLREYPAALFYDHSKQNYERKKRAFTGVENLKLITPSGWLAGLARDSFLGCYPIEVQYNEIDKSVFKPAKSNFRKKYGLDDKIMILGVANVWGKQKGLDDFMELSRMLDKNYAVVLVGVREKNIRKLPKNMRSICQLKAAEKLEAADGEIQKDCRGTAVPEGVENLYQEITGKPFRGVNDRDIHASVYCLPGTKNAEELAMIYSAADFFVNPSHEDTYPTTNLEAMACGTHVITYDIGGSKETLVQR